MTDSGRYHVIVQDARVARYDFERFQDAYDCFMHLACHVEPEDAFMDVHIVEDGLGCSQFGASIVRGDPLRVFQLSHDGTAFVSSAADPAEAQEIADRVGGRSWVSVQGVS